MQIDFDVFELISDLKPVGNAKYINNNEIRLELEDRVFILKEKVENKNIANSNNFSNNFTKIIKEKYPKIRFLPDAIKKLSLYLRNSHYSVVSPKFLVKEFGNILKDFNQSSRSSCYGYIAYFVEDGSLSRNDKGNYVILKNNLVPTQKKEKKDLGFLDELGMS